MTVYTTIGFFVAMLLLATSPGPGVFAVVASALSSGFKGTIPVICGIVMGDILFLLLAVFGLSVVATVLGDLFFLVRICGGIYLFILGMRLIFTKPRPTPESSKLSGTNQLSRLISGLVITLSNPKVILFYCGFLPTFLDLSKTDAVDLVVIIGIVTFVLAAVMSAYALMVSRARTLLKQPKSLRRLNQAAGSMMATVGIILIARS